MFTSDAARAQRPALAIPPKFEAAVREFAGWVGADPDAMVRGETHEIGGVPVTLMHYGPLDPDGATVVVDFGELRADAEGFTLRTLLEHNLRMPAAKQGCFALAPGLDRILFCIRVDLVATEHGAADAIAQVVAMAVESVRAIGSSIVQQVDALQGKSVAATARMA